MTYHLRIIFFSVFFFPRSLSSVLFFCLCVRVRGRMGWWELASSIQSAFSVFVHDPTRCHGKML